MGEAVRLASVDELAGLSPAPDVLVVALVGDRTADAAADARVLTAQGLETVQAMLSTASADLCVVFVTRGAVCTEPNDQVSDLAAAAAAGLVRSAQTENPGRFRHIDTDGTGASQQVMASAVACDEPALALRGGIGYRPRLGVATAELVPPAEGQPWRVDLRERGTLEGLALLPAPDVVTPLGPGQVRIGVRAAGLNFRDVLIALGSYPGEGTVGGEGAGIVLDVGPGVVGLQSGDRVMGMFDGAMGPVAVADHRLVVPIPDGWSFAEAAAVTAVFLTAYYGLKELAGLQAGDRVLIHAATGGVGTAAVQIARQVGAEVFATASPGKWDVLRSMGFNDDHIASSRTAEFEEKFLRVTEGRGMDVVLDCLAGELVDASLRLLPGGGRFVEMGKTDIRDPAQVAADHPGVVYRAFDLDDAGPEHLGEMLHEVIELFARGHLRLPPVSARDVRHAPAAFRFLSQAKHIGKLVLTMPPHFDATGTVLVTGGTGGLGAEVARHLVVEHGIRHLLLASRSGPDAPGASDLQAELTALGGQVTIAACDVADRDHLARLLGDIPEHAPLTGVVHAAGVLDDGTIGSLTPERIARVFAPKIDGAWHLHELTKNLPLSMFVMFSSAAGVLGEPGQGNYAAANAFLDALAAHRRTCGLPATSLAWGFWQQRSGMTAHLNETDLRRMRRTGSIPITPSRGLELFDAGCAAPQPALVPMPIDWPAAREQAAAGLASPLFLTPSGTEGRRTAAQSPGGQNSRPETLMNTLVGLSDEDRQLRLTELVQTHAATVLGLTGPADVEPDRPFNEIGFESLAAVELRNRLSTASGLRLPATLVFDHPNPVSLARFLSGELRELEPDAATMSIEAFMADLDRLIAALPRVIVSKSDSDRVTQRIDVMARAVEKSKPAHTDELEKKIASASDEEIFTFIDEELNS